MEKEGGVSVMMKMMMRMVRKVRVTMLMIVMIVMMLMIVGGSRVVRNRPTRGRSVYLCMMVEWMMMRMMTMTIGLLSSVCSHHH